MSRMIIIQTSGVGKAVPGDFGVAVEDDIARVPKDVFSMCRKHGSRILEDLLSLAWVCPSDFVDDLGWSHDDVQTALSKAAQQLNGIVSDRVLKPPPPSSFAGRDLPPEPE